MLDDQGRKVLNVGFGMPYTLKAEISKSDGMLPFLFNPIKKSTSVLEYLSKNTNRLQNQVPVKMSVD